MTSTRRVFFFDRLDQRIHVGTLMEEFVNGAARIRFRGIGFQPFIECDRGHWDDNIDRLECSVASIGSQKHQTPPGQGSYL